MRNSFVIIALMVGILAYGNSPNWGKTGHRATAEIATTHLTKKAKKKISELLDGDSPALVSTYPDDIKSDSKYDKYSIWHFVNIPEGKTYDEAKDDLEPENIVMAIEKAKKALKDDSTPREKKQFYLKFLIHLIGDLHQPLHIGRPDDLGGNTIIVFWFGDPSNLHRVWDSDMLDSFKMSYSELAANEQMLSKEEYKAIEQGNVEDWVRETLEITNQIYDSARNGDQLGYNYMYDWMPVVRQQLQKGGIRLAKELNDIFG